MDFPNYVVIPFKGKTEMTWDLVQQLIQDDSVVQVFLMANEPVVGPYPWDSVTHSRCVTVNSDGHGLHTMWNHGINLAVESALLYEYGRAFIPKVNVAILNNDLRLETTDYILSLSHVLRSAESVGVVSGIPVEWVTPDVLPGMAWESGGGYLQGNAMMVRSELPFRFDERFIWYFGDTDFFAQIQNSGYRALLAANSVHTHLGGGSQTITELPTESFNNAIANDRDIFYSKWPQIPVDSREIPSNLLRTL